MSPRCNGIVQSRTSNLPLNKGKGHMEDSQRKNKVVTQGNILTAEEPLSKTGDHPPKNPQFSPRCTSKVQPQLSSQQVDKGEEQRRVCQKKEKLWLITL